MYLRVKFLLLSALVLCQIAGYFSDAYASNPDVKEIVKVKEYARSSFSPTKDETFTIEVEITNPDKVKQIDLSIVSYDGDLIRSSLSKKIDKKTAVRQFSWDGRDNKGNVVADESYHPIIKVSLNDGSVVEWDAKKFSGGKEVYEFPKRYRPNIIEYELPQNSRVLIRAGEKNGAMLRTIVDWEPRVSGLHIERWNGKDADDVAVIETNPKLAYLIVGYELPFASIITYGNDKQTYREYREANKMPVLNGELSQRELLRDGKVMRREFYTPVLKQKSPRIDLSLREVGKGKEITKLALLDEVIVNVGIHELDEMYLDQQRYEISFFIDGEFISEEEQGFVPYTWCWSPGRHGIIAGKHVLTVNVSGYEGQVGVKHLEFELEEEVQ